MVDFCYKCQHRRGCSVHPINQMHPGVTLAVIKCQWRDQPVDPEEKLTMSEVEALLDAIFDDCPEGGPYCIGERDWKEYLPLPRPDRKEG